MRIGATEGKGTHTSSTRLDLSFFVLADFPVQSLSRHLEWRLLQFDQGIKFLHMQRLGNVLLSQHQDGLEQTCDASSGFKMTDVRLYRTKETRSVFRLGSLGSHQPLFKSHNFHRVAQHRSRAMCLDITDRCGINTSGLIASPDQFRLSLWIRNR
ncbi:hypothetical protein N9118_00545 [Akkermansiaceae bacterium]|nr:hypothetical protein [Akkermansiaceae bacterium]